MSDESGRGAGGTPGNDLPETPGGELAKLALSWLVVGIPALWGVAQVVQKSLSLFRR